MISKLLGYLWERKAVRFLRGRGYRIIDRNFRTKFGEIDIVAQDGKEIVFVEVKGRGGLWRPEEAVDGRKLRRIYKAAMVYLKKKGFRHSSFRFDVVAIDRDGIRHIKGVGYEL